MKMKKKDAKRVFYYKEYTDDVVVSANQEYKLPADYEWIGRGRGEKIASQAVYITAVIFGFIYCRLFLHMSVKNRKVIKEYLREQKKSGSKETRGIYIYANHTQPLGDVFIPALANIYSRVYVMVSQANYGIPVIGRILPELGALPVPETLSGYKKFAAACKKRISQGKAIVIYPEAHVWPYCSMIRPFGAASFRFPCEQKTAAFCITTVYKKRRIGDRPKAEVYVDGPFYPDESLGIKQRQAKLRDSIYVKMCERSSAGDCEYYRYLHK